MTTERQWVHQFIEKFDKELKRAKQNGFVMSASDGTKLAYTCEIHKYDSGGTPVITSNRYETDILISDILADGSWIPRVVIECKLRKVTTHDALTYSAKASSHRAVHPYLRYGFLAGGRENYALPARLVRHGQHFDFMTSWKAMKATAAEWRAFSSLVRREAQASRKLQLLLTDNRSSTRVKFSSIQKQMNFVETKQPT